MARRRRNNRKSARQAPIEVGAVVPARTVSLKQRASKRNRLSSDWQPTNATGDTYVGRCSNKLRAKARSLDRENDYVISGLNKLITKTLGETSPVFKSTIYKQRGKDGQPALNRTLNQQVEAAFKLWATDKKSCDTSQRYILSEILELCLRALAVDGQVFLRKINVVRGRSPVPFALELIETDCLADGTFAAHQEGQNTIINGIEYDEWGAPVAYWFYPYNPSDIWGKWRSTGRGTNIAPERVPANQIIHFYAPRRISQGQGVTWLAATVGRLRDLVGYEEAVLTGARMRASVMGFIETIEGEETVGEKIADDEPRQYAFEPGTINVLNPSEKFNLANPTDPGPNLEGFGRYMLRAFAANLGIAYSSLSGDYSQANYSSERANQVDERRGIRRLQDKVRNALLNPLTDWFIEAATLTNTINLPANYLSDPLCYCQYKWTLGGFEWVDPLKDANAFTKQLENGLTSLQRVLAEKNIDIETLIEERQNEEELLAAAGITPAYLLAGKPKELPVAPEPPPEPAPPPKEKISMDEFSQSLKLEFDKFRLDADRAAFEQQKQQDLRDKATLDRESALRAEVDAVKGEVAGLREALTVSQSTLTELRNEVLSAWSDLQATLKSLPEELSKELAAVTIRIQSSELPQREKEPDQQEVCPTPEPEPVNVLQEIFEEKLAETKINSDQPESVAEANTPDEPMEETE